MPAGKYRSNVPASLPSFVSVRGKMTICARIRDYRCHRLIAAVVISCLVTTSVLLVPLVSLLSRSIDASQVKYGYKLTYKTWLDHLCPRSQIRNAPAQQLKWEPPSAQTIFFMQTSCANALTAREVGYNVGVFVINSRVLCMSYDNKHLYLSWINKVVMNQYKKRKFVC